MNISAIQNISYCAKMKELYTPLKRDMTNYVLNSDEIQLSELESITKKYSPETKYDSFEHVPAKVSSTCRGYTQTPVAIISDEGEVIGIKIMPETVYINFPKNLDKNSRIELLNRILHESTHVLQRHADDRLTEEDLYNNFLHKDYDIIKFIDNIKASDNFIFNRVENDMIGILSLYCQNESDIPKPVRDDLTLDDVMISVANKNATAIAKESILKAINEAKTMYDKLDINFILNSIERKAMKEYEAYTNGVKSTKEILNIKNKTDFDLKIEIYSKITEAVFKIKKEI